MRQRKLIDFNLLRDFLESIQSDTEDLIFGPAQGQPLYHYTDLAGLQGIVRHHDLWLTNSRYSNDDEEVTHGYHIVQQVINEERGRLPPPPPDRLNYLERVSDLVKEPTPEGVYICCFCLDDNLLSQWRGYGANGTGVSLRFNPVEFSAVTGQDSPHGGLMRLWKVFYDADRQKNIVKKALDFAFFSDLARPVEDRAQQAADAIQFFIPAFKNGGFREERECRLIFTPPPNCPVQPDFRVARGMLVPYYSLQKLSGSQLSQLPITGILLGPSANKLLNRDSAKMLLRQAGYANVEPETSEIPFRG